MHLPAVHNVLFQGWVHRDADTTRVLKSSDDITLVIPTMHTTELLLRMKLDTVLELAEQTRKYF